MILSAMKETRDGRHIDFKLSDRNRVEVAAKDQDVLLRITAQELQRLLHRAVIYGNKHPDPFILSALKNAAKWLIKAQDQGVHKACVAPNHLNTTINAVNVAIKQIDKELRQ